MFGFYLERLSVGYLEVLASFVFDRVANWLIGGVAKFDGAGDFFSQYASEDNRLLFGSVEREVDIEMHYEE